jgi:beta-1,4-N-acetylglucosaminyltransferase
MGDSGDSVKQEKKVVFVTVGTTLFDALVRTMDTKEVKQELLRKGYTDLVIQMGRGSYTPTKVFSLIFHSLFTLAFVLLGLIRC